MEKIAPHPCFGCEKIGTVLCDNCKYNIISEPFSGCCLCGDISVLGICAHHDVPICKVWVVSERVGVLKRVINAYKFEYTKAAAHALVDLLDDALPLLPANTIVVPVPTASSHVRQRGYDHLDILVRLFAQRRGLTVARFLERGSSKTQHRLNKAERQQEAGAAFYLSPLYTINPLVPLLVIDDIITTGATITSVSKVLHTAGAETIFVAALAYQPLD